MIRDHIRSFPARSSHYSHSDNSGRVYLSPELSIARLYRDFLERHDPEFIKKQEENHERVISPQPQEALPKPIASQHFYHDILVTEFNIYFCHPRLDTCDTCNSLTNKIDDAKAVGEDTQELEKELEAHKELAQTGYKTFQHDQLMSQKSSPKTYNATELYSLHGCSIVILGFVPL